MKLLYVKYDSVVNMSNGEECEICFYTITNGQPYCKINNRRENGVYHMECVEAWLQRSNNGFHVQEAIISYSMFQNDELIETIKVDTNRYGENFRLINNNTITSSNENENTSTPSSSDKACCCVLF